MFLKILTKKSKNTVTPISSLMEKLIGLKVLNSRTKVHVVHAGHFQLQVPLKLSTTLDQENPKTFLNNN